MGEEHPTEVGGERSLLPTWFRGCERLTRQTVSEWADAERVMPDGSHWRTERVPYLREIMDSFHDHTAAIVVVQKANQFGGSEVLNNLIGYCARHAQRRIIMAHPTLELGESYVKDRIEPMFHDSPGLHGAMVEGRSRQRGVRESTLRHKIFRRGWLAIVGANSPASMRQRTADLTLADDADGYPASAGEEGDPFDLLVRRMVRVRDGKAYIVSTPTLKDGRIDTWYTRSDQRRYVMPCPTCGRWDYFDWQETGGHFWVKMNDVDPATAHLRCPVQSGGCGAAIGDAERVEMIRAGRWQATAAPQLPRVRGYHIWEAYATWRLLSQTAEDFLRANARGPSALRVWVNQARGEAWEERPQTVDWMGYVAQREDYGEGVEVPEPAVYVTAGADMQIDRVELLVMAWGQFDERWIVDYRIISGNIKAPETKEALLLALSARYWHARGCMVPIQVAALDSGFETDAVYDFVLANQYRGIIATKGFAQRSGKPIIGKGSRDRAGAARPVRLYPINVDDAKKEVHEAAQRPRPAPGHPGPGVMHFPRRVDTIDEAFFAGLFAEHREPVKNRAGIVTHEVWAKDRVRNEPLDLAVLNLAAYRLRRPRYEQWAEYVRSLPVERRPVEVVTVGGVGSVYDDESP